MRHDTYDWRRIPCALLLPVQRVCRADTQKPERGGHDWNRKDLNAVLDSYAAGGMPQAGGWGELQPDLAQQQGRADPPQCAYPKGRDSDYENRRKLWRRRLFVLCKRKARRKAAGAVLYRILSVKRQKEEAQDDTGRYLYTGSGCKL